MNNPLADLKDIHTPDGISWWPPAYGWWLLALLIIVLVVWLIVYINRRYALGLAKRQAIKELNTLDGTSEQWPVTLNSLLKRLILSYQPAIPVQQLYGEELVRLLTAALPQKSQQNFKQQMSTLQQSLYQNQALSAHDFEHYKALVLAWIKSARLADKKAKLRLAACCEQQSTKPQGIKYV